MSNCLGVGATALTKDNYVILMERAKWTGEYPGKIDRPGDFIVFIIAYLQTIFQNYLEFA